MVIFLYVVNYKKHVHNVWCRDVRTDLVMAEDVINLVDDDDDGIGVIAVGTKRTRGRPSGPSQNNVAEDGRLNADGVKLIKCTYDYCKHEYNFALNKHAEVITLHMLNVHRVNDNMLVTYCMILHSSRD